MFNIHCKYDELLELKKFNLHPKNRNKHAQDQIDRLCKLYEYHGIRHPIIVSSLSGYIVAGHGRLAAAKQLKMESFPVVYQDFDSEEHEYAFLQADNAIALWAELDIEGIKTDLEQFPELDHANLGIKDFEVKVETVPKADEDEVPEKVEPKAKLGDIYKLGNHRLMCGDSTSIDAVEKLMNGEKADMVFTDPPYGVSYTKKTKEVFNSKEYTEIKNDDKSGENLKDFFRDLFSSLFTALHDKSSYYICSPQGGDSEMMMMMMMRECGIKCRHQIIWVKDAPVFSMGRLDYDYKHEPILYGWVKTHDFKRNGSQDKSVWEFKRTENKLHPTMKPVELVENAILNSSDVGQNVIDICGGSGSTLIACEKTNRKCFMMELDPHYIDVIIARWEQYTGKKAELLNGQT